jgi:hypothetical protein
VIGTKNWSKKHVERAETVKLFCCCTAETGLYRSTLETKNRVLLGDFIKNSYTRPVLPDLRAADPPDCTKGKKVKIDQQIGHLEKRLE